MGSVPWPRAHGKIGPCDDPVVCRALARLGTGVPVRRSRGRQSCRFAHAPHAPRPACARRCGNIRPMVSRSPAKAGHEPPNEPVAPEPSLASNGAGRGERDQRERSDDSDSEHDAAHALPRFGRDGAPEPEQYSVEFEEGRIESGRGQGREAADPRRLRGVPGRWRRARLADRTFPQGLRRRDQRAPGRRAALVSATSRIIGRRFRLVHVLFGGGKVIEDRDLPPPTRRGARAESEDLLIRNDNVFGEAHQDAYRRDFTINGLFYDLEHNLVLDWVRRHGRRRAPRGAHHRRARGAFFRKTRCASCAAIKFAAQLDLGITPEVYDAIVQCRGALRKAARPRLFEEVLRLLRSGASRALFGWRGRPACWTSSCPSCPPTSPICRKTTTACGASCKRGRPHQPKSANRPWMTPCFGACSCSSDARSVRGRERIASKPLTPSSSRSSIV